jgi:hypothetical protein
MDGVACTIHPVARIRVGCMSLILINVFMIKDDVMWLTGCKVM